MYLFIICLLFSFFSSTLASSLLSSIADFLDNGIDEYTTSLLDFSAQDEEDCENGEEEIDTGKEDRHPHNPSKRNSEFRLLSLFISL